MNIQEFQTSRGGKPDLHKSDKKNPNMEKLSRLIDECNEHDIDIKTGIEEYKEKMQRYRIEQKQYDLIRDTF